MFIASLPPVHQHDLLRRMIEHPCVDAVRYNTGMSSAYSPLETIERIQALARPLKKPVYIDLKGKQLRVIEWANLPEGPIVLNHPVRVSLPAKVYFRGDDCCALREVVDGTNIYVDPLPKAPVGRGQAANIVGKNVLVSGGLLPLDHEYIKAGVACGISRFMLSFVEHGDDVEELQDAILKHNHNSKPISDYELVLKIESRLGVSFVRKNRPNTWHENGLRLMAARDDLMIQIGINKMPHALQTIAAADEHAICASRLFLGLEQGAVSMADLSDFKYMQQLGYQHFMLSDGVSRNHFNAALSFWKSLKKS
ncbi:MAG: hypothetical protein KGI50_01610 [Patescibacteria group bacterium]|nr:hypothetical protein [Patescibacteria group bacterium]MDE2437960.1 hypothetical protein [Patescibacteria group bacterium]